MFQINLVKLITLRYLHKTIFVLLVLHWCVVDSGLAQTDGTNDVPLLEKAAASIASDTLNPKQVDSFLWEYKYRRSPKRAGMYSALVPGLGQIYNRQYWKVAIVYAAIGTSTGFIIYNLSEYNNTRKEIADRITLGYAVNPKYSFLDDNQLLRQEEYYKNNLDISVLLTGVGYLLQIMEAISANHMKEFDITPDISMRFKMTPLPHQQIGVGVAFNFK